MKLYTFQAEGQVRIGAGLKNYLVDLPAAYSLLSRLKGPFEVPALPSDMIRFLRGGEKFLKAAADTIAFVKGRPPVPVGETIWFDFSEVKLLAPIPRPGKILCSGLNYYSHCQENPAARLPEEPFFFSKVPSTVIAAGETIIIPTETQQLDYEVEFAVVIGSRSKAASPDEAMAGVAGYTILHDVSARDVQFKDNQITLGKNFDTFCPLGPCIVTKDELPDLSDVRLRSVLNGTVMQDGSTKDWIFPLPKLLSHLSQVMTLEPGDVISTGTPAGVGYFRKPQVFLKDGDTVRLEIDGLGSLENPVRC
jgi:2-keto-4-pentenoate hydratase/2-oxohepta-3-ene-1,7-dioic acid hydratase in catechol pathway